MGTRSGYHQAVRDGMTKSDPSYTITVTCGFCGEQDTETGSCLTKHVASAVFKRAGWTVVDGQWRCPEGACLPPEEED